MLKTVSEHLYEVAMKHDQMFYAISYEEHDKDITVSFDYNPDNKSYSLIIVIPGKGKIVVDEYLSFSKEELSDERDLFVQRVQEILASIVEQQEYDFFKKALEEHAKSLSI